MSSAEVFRNLLTDSSLEISAGIDRACARLWRAFDEKHHALGHVCVRRSNALLADNDGIRDKSFEFRRR